MKKSKKLIISEWEETILLDDLDGIIKEKVALAFEETNNYLQNLSDDEYEELIIIFALIRIVLPEINDKYIFNIEEFIKLYYKYENGLNIYFNQNDDLFPILDQEDNVTVIADSMIDYINKKYK